MRSGRVLFLGVLGGAAVTVLAFLLTGCASKRDNMEFSRAYAVGAVGTNELQVTFLGVRPDDRVSKCTDAYELRATSENIRLISDTRLVKGQHRLNASVLLGSLRYKK